MHMRILKIKKHYLWERVESLISRENTLWISTHKENKKEK